METEKKTMPESTTATDANGKTDSTARPVAGREPLAFVCPICGSSDLWHCSRSTVTELTEIAAVFEDGEEVPGYTQIDDMQDFYYFCGECQKEFYFGFSGDDSKLLAQWMLKGCPAQEEAAHVGENGTQPERP